MLKWDESEQERREHLYKLTPEEAAQLPGRVKAILTGHIGRENSITAAKIARALGLNDPDGRRVRAAIAELRADEEPICADPAAGFWWCSNAEEGIAFMDRLDGIIRDANQLKIEFRKAFNKHFRYDPGQPRML